MVVLSQIIREVFIGTYLLFPDINAGFAVVRAARNHMSIVARASLERTMRQSASKGWKMGNTRQGSEL